MTDVNERARLSARILEHTHQVFTYLGGREALAELKARGFILGIVTDTIYPLEWKMSWLAKAGVAEFIDVSASGSYLSVPGKRAGVLGAIALAQALVE